MKLTNRVAYVPVGPIAQSGLSLPEAEPSLVVPVQMCGGEPDRAAETLLGALGSVGYQFVVVFSGRDEARWVLVDRVMALARDIGASAWLVIEMPSDELDWIRRRRLRKLTERFQCPVFQAVGEAGLAGAAEAVGRGLAGKTIATPTAGRSGVGLRSPIVYGELVLDPDIGEIADDLRGHAVLTDSRGVVYSMVVFGDDTAVDVIAMTEIPSLPRRTRWRSGLARSRATSIGTGIAELDALTGGLPHGLTLVCETAASKWVATAEMVFQLMDGVFPEARAFLAHPSSVDRVDPLGSVLEQLREWMRTPAHRRAPACVVVLHDVLVRHPVSAVLHLELLEQIETEIDGSVVATIRLEPGEGGFGVPERIACRAAMIAVMSVDDDGRVIGHVVKHPSGVTGRFRVASSGDD